MFILSSNPLQVNNLIQVKATMSYHLSSINMGKLEKVMSQHLVTCVGWGVGILSAYGCWKD